MKRFHVHIAVDKLEESIRFYSAVFGAQPSVVKPDYAKWMLEDPRINFAISHQGHAAGLNHLGFQLESDDELKAMRSQLESADTNLLEENGVSCCYAKSDKYWITDPTGIAWETFRSLGSIPVYGEGTSRKAGEAECCIPMKTSEHDKAGAGCCVPSDRPKDNKAAACCG